MSRIPMTNNFSVIPEGTYVFNITEATYDEDFGKVEVKMATAEGHKHIERYRLKTNGDEFNQKALNALSYFAKNALNDFNRVDFDVSELVGRYIRATVGHTTLPSTSDPSKTVTFANLSDWAPANGYDTSPATIKSDLDIDELLNF